MSLSFPREINLEILSYVSLQDLAVCCRLSKKSKEIASNEKLWCDAIARDFAFGKEWWEKNYGDVGEVPPLPKNIVQILKSPCPYWKDKITAVTRILALIPKTVNGEPFSSDHLIQSKIPGHPYIEKSDAYDAVLQNTEKSYWLLMTNNVVPGTCTQAMETQKNLVEVDGYQMAERLEAAVGILASLSKNSLNSPFERVSTITTDTSKSYKPPFLRVGPNTKFFGLRMYYTFYDILTDLGAVAVKRLS